MPPSLPSVRGPVKRAGPPPLPPPPPGRVGRPAALTHRAPGQDLSASQLARPHRAPARAEAAGARPGSRSGANWRRHGDTGTDQLIIGHLNIQSYKPKLHDLRNDIHDTYGFDVLALCETWLTPPVPDRLIGVNGYKLHRRDRPAGSSLPRGKGGVAVLVRDSLTCELPPTPVTGVTNPNLEIVWVLVRTSKHRAVLVASAYRVPHNTARQLTTDLGLVS